MVLDNSSIEHTFPSTIPAHMPVKKSTSLQTKPKPLSNEITVNIPKPPNSFNRDEYRVMPKSPRHALDNSTTNGNVNLTVSSKKEKDTLILRAFENQMLEIFEAQDRLAPDTSAMPTTIDRTIFYQPDDSEDSEPSLSIGTQEALQRNLTQLVSNNRLRDVSSDYLKRLQAICEPAIETAQTTNLKLQASASDDDISAWLSQLQKAESGISSACTLAYIVLGNVQNEDLVNLEVLQWLPNVLVNVFENCLMPVVEARPDAQDAQLFEVASSNREAVKRLLDLGRKFLDLLAKICIEVKGAGSLVNATEFLASRLIFVQNAGSEKTSAIGVQVFERVRKQAMAALARLYAAFPSERDAILDEVLSSLDKLPSNSRSARQYKLGNGKSIQLVSALFMQLVQTPAIPSGNLRFSKLTAGQKQRRRTVDVESEDDDSLEDENDTGLEDDLMDKDPSSRLARQAGVLLEDASKSAQQIVLWMVDKASKVTKSGDSPYRNILDLFIEDLTVVLPLTDWPASELLLTILARRMIMHVDNDKAASTKNMALEALGVMGSAISTTRASARHLSSSISQTSESSATVYRLCDLVKENSQLRIADEDLVSSHGPFSLVHTFLRAKGGDGLRSRSARAYLLVRHATHFSKASKTRQSNGDLDAITDGTAARVLQQLEELDNYHGMSADEEDVTVQEAQLAYTLCILNMPFCNMFPRIATTLTSCLSSDQAQVRSRSIKSVTTILETDSSLLDWVPTVADDVLRCATDDSSLVRDSALTLIAKFIVPRPSPQLQHKGFTQLLRCTGDANVGIQKRAIVHLKDFYLTDARTNLKDTITTEFLRRTSDLETSVAELARKTLLEIWISPRLEVLNNHDDNARLDVAINELRTQIVSCISRSSGALGVPLKDFLVWTLKHTKSIDKLHNLYSRIVKKLLETANGSEAEPADLTTLVAFAEARPQTIHSGDLASLKSYLKDMKPDEMPKFRSVVTIFRCVLPNLSSTQSQLLEGVQQDLMRSAGSLARLEDLQEVMSCLRSIDGVLHQTRKLAVFAVSVLQNVIQPKVAPKTKEALISQNKAAEIPVRESIGRQKMLRLLGSIFKFLDFEQQVGIFKNAFPAFKAGSVVGFVCDTIVPFTFKRAEAAVRLKAFECLGSICQAWPGQFNKKHIRETFFQVLDGSAVDTLGVQDAAQAKLTVLTAFEGLYAARTKAKADGTSSEEDTEVQALKNIGGDHKTREDDSAISTITSTVVSHLLRIAMSAKGEEALLATKTLASIDHQGMTHPKESTAAFVALETNPDARVSQAATIAHRHLHQQHESVCEREYVHAVSEACRYQIEVFDDPRGATMPGYKPKLAAAFEIISGSGSKYVRKFLGNIVSKLNTEHSKLEIGPTGACNHLYFTLFVCQNLAFFEYKKMDELLHAVLQLELVFGKNGGETAQAIEMELGPMLTEQANADEAENGNQAMDMESKVSVDQTVLRRLSVAACAISLISETRNFLKRQYGISRDVKLAVLQSKQTKDSTKEPTRVHGITGDRYWTATNGAIESLDSTEGMLSRCRELLRIVSVDDEVKIAAEDDGDGFGMESGPEQVWTGQRGKKRKSAGSMGGTPKKARGRLSKQGARRSSSTSSLEEHPDGDFAG